MRGARVGEGRVCVCVMGGSVMDICDVDPPPPRDVYHVLGSAWRGDRSRLSRSAAMLKAAESPCWPAGARYPSAPRAQRTHIPRPNKPHTDHLLGEV